MKPQDTRTLGNTEVGLLAGLTPVFYLVACCLFSLPVMVFYTPWYTCQYGDPPLVEAIVAILLFDMVWGALMWRVRLVKSRRARIYISVVVYTLSASIITDFHVMAWLKGGFS